MIPLQHVAPRLLYRERMPNIRLVTTSAGTKRLASTTVQTVLVADADPTTRAVTEHVLRCHGLTPTSSAIDDDSAAPDASLVLLDVTPARRDVLKQIERFGAHPSWRNIPLICTARYATPSLRTHALENGATDFISLPIEPTELVIRICHQLRQAQRVSELLAQAQIDELTGLLNRRGLLSHMEKALAHARRAETDCSILMLDLDGFKTINDTLGHAVGDDVLRAVGNTLQSAFRSEDSVSRLGGDEFVVLLPSTGAAGADQSMARLRTLFGQLCVAGYGQGVAASIGAFTAAKAQRAEGLLAEADERMYADKRRRRRARAA